MRVDYRFNVRTDCSGQCACTINRHSYDPVCGSDNRTYFSPCFAGCTRLVNQVRLIHACLDLIPVLLSTTLCPSSRTQLPRPGQGHKKLSKARARAKILFQGQGQGHKVISKPTSRTIHNSHCDCCDKIVGRNSKYRKRLFRVP